MITKKFKVLIKAVHLLIPVFGFAKGPCDEELKKYCPEFTPGRTSVSMCLEPNLSKLSPACKNQRIQFKKIMEKVVIPCRSDLDIYCGEIEIVPGSLKACIDEFRTNFNLRCQSELKEFEDAKKKANSPSAPPATVTIEMNGDIGKDQDLKEKPAPKVAAPKRTVNKKGKESTKKDSP